MSNDDVVIDESNPTNEDLSIDKAIESLYEVTEEPVEGNTSAEDEASVEDVDADKESEDNTGNTDNAEEGADGEDGEFSLPENMPKEFQESLADLSEEAQKRGVEVFKKMQGSFTKKNQDFAEEKKFVEGLNRAFEDNGLNVGVEQKQKLISNYIAFDKQLEDNPKEAIKQMMDYAGLKPDDFGASPTPTYSSDDEFLTDSERKTTEQINTLTEQVNKLTQREKQGKAQAQQQVVDEFFDAKDEDGNLLHPHFDLVYNDMKVLASDKSLSIEQLYNKAVRMNDYLFKQAIGREKESALKSVEAKRKAEVEKAKKLNRQSRPVSSVDSTVVDEDTMFDQIASQAGWG